jgi:hypothetical protein
MLSREDIDAAVQAGIISSSQRISLAAFAESRHAAELSDADAESVHFIRGFHDIFMSIGIALLLSGIVLAGPLTGSPQACTLLAFITAWGLAEFLTGRRRLILPSIVLAISVTVLALYLGLSVISVLGSWKNLSFVPVMIPAAGFIAGLAFYARFRLPFALAVIVATLIGTFFVVLYVYLPNFTETHVPLLVLIAGLVTFAAAMWQDLRDRNRQTLTADNAFWLHLLAAPLMVHALVSLLIGGDLRSMTGLYASVVVLVIVGILALIAIIIDRRALLVSGLGYVGIAIAQLIRETEISSLGVTAITMVILGAAVVSLGSGWHAARAGLLRITPRRLAEFLPPAQ